MHCLKAMNISQGLNAFELTTMTVLQMTSTGSSAQSNSSAGSVDIFPTTSASEPEIRNILWQYKNNRSITTPLHYVILVSYIVIGCLAILSNSLVVLAVIRNKKVRTPRNLLIFNLAVTDLALAATIPFSASDALSKYWPWGPENNILCKLSHSLPTTLVFMVSVIIIIIAVDRYRCIVVRTQVQLDRFGALLVLPVSFLVASAVSIPLLIHSQLVKLPAKVVASLIKDSVESPEVAFCMEKWSDTNAADLIMTHRAVYSILVAIFQYLLPLLIVLFIYALIYKFLGEQQYPRHLRQSKTNKLLASISLTHCVIWLPFSIFNILADLSPTIFGKDPETIITVYCIVHLVGLASTCTNPVLYAFFNENLRREFDGILECVLPGFRSEEGSRRSRPERRRKRRCRIVFRKKLQSSAGSSVRSQRLEDDEAHFIDGHVTLMTVQQASAEGHGSEDDMLTVHQGQTNGTPFIEFQDENSSPDPNEVEMEVFHNGGNEGHLLHSHTHLNNVQVKGNKKSQGRKNNAAFILKPFDLQSENSIMEIEEENAELLETVH